MIIEMMKSGMEVGFLLNTPKKSVEVHYNRFLAK